MDGDHVEHWLNGLKVLEYERGGEEFLAMKAKSKFSDRPEYGLQKEGHILLQDHSSRVGFRNIRIKVLRPNSIKD
ncbi:MAG: family 16 glycoside hydrolase [Bacteroidales bacterium]